MPKMQLDCSTEEDFFASLSACLPGQVLYNGNSGEATAALRELGLEFPNNHWELGLPETISTRLDVLLQALGGTRRDWPRGSLLSHVDGLIVRPPLGPCLVEFDEEQHFSPYRRASLDALEGLVEVRYGLSAYREYCRDPAKFREFWRTSRLPARLLPGRGVVESSAQLASILFRNQRDLPDSGYFRAVAGFPFTGGRIAQRAYYDTLRDCVHESPQWQACGMKPVFRISVWDVETFHALPRLNEDSPHI